MEINRDERHLNLFSVLQRKSCFLFGPHQVGKSEFINRFWPNMSRRIFSLQSLQTFFEFCQNPGKELCERHAKYCEKPGTVFVIDDIHRLPVLLDEAYRLIKERDARFLFVTSSAHKLVRNGGRIQTDYAEVRVMHPLSAREIGPGFKLKKALNNGLLPLHYHSDKPETIDFRSYVYKYLEEELLQGGGAACIPSFYRLLTAVAQRNGALVNYADLAVQAGIPRTTVQEYVKTLITSGMVVELPAWTKTARRAIRTSKFYVFDVGVANYLQGCDALAVRRGEVVQRPKTAVAAFHHWVFHELRCYIDSIRVGASLAFWRSAGGSEVDFILNDETAIAVSSSVRVGTVDLKDLRVLQKEKLFKRYLLVCGVEQELEIDGLVILPWQTFVKKLWDKELG